MPYLNPENVLHTHDRIRHSGNSVDPRLDYSDMIQQPPDRESKNK